MSQLAERHKEFHWAVFRWASNRVPDVFLSMGMLRACTGISVRMGVNPPNAGHQSAGSFGWNVTQETHNGLCCVRCCQDDCCHPEETDMTADEGDDD